MKKINLVIAIFTLTFSIYLSKLDFKNNTAIETLSSLTLANAQQSEEQGTENPNYAYFEKLVSEPIYNTVYELDSGLKVLKVPVASVVVATYQNQFLGVNKSCEYSLFSRCDQNKVGFYPAPGIGG